MSFVGALETADDFPIVRLDVSRLSLQRLNTGLFIHRKNQRILRGIQVQTHDVGGLGCELRIGADAPTALPCQTYAFFPQYSRFWLATAANSHGRVAYLRFRFV